VLGVNIEAFQSPKSSKQSGKGAEIDVDESLVQFNGSGIREALRIILDIEFLRPDIILIEEPEVHLHPSLEINMLQYLKRKSNDCQIFITTHSTNFVDTTEMRNVYLVSKVDSTQVELLNLEEAETKIPKELGIRLSSLFMYDRLIFVEGPSDENILRELSSKLEFNLGQYNVGFVRMGGARNFAYYATEDTLSFLTKRRVKMWFLIDKDEKDQEYFKELENKLNGQATIKILNRRELENYLICPRAIIEFIRLKQGFGGISEILPNESKIKKDINECADLLKQFTINKRLFLHLFNPIYPSSNFDFENINESQIKEITSKEVQRMIKILVEKKNKIEEIYNIQKEVVNKNWETSKLFLVPGDLLIDKVCQKYNVRFNKAKDGARIANLMLKEEIEGDIKEILKEVCNS
jgi:putative ATP-dependent endonuclease of OLD family